MLPELALEKLRKVATELNFVKYDIKADAGSAHGNNFRGIMVAVCLTGTRNINDQLITDSVRLFCKYAPANKDRCKSLRIDVAFNREHFVYSQIFPAFIAFQREKGLNEAELFSSIPKVYASESDSETNAHIIIMEDLRALNYELWPKEENIPIEHELLLMEELGKMHGVALAMKDQRPNEFEAFTWITEPLSVMMTKSTALFRELCQKIANAVEDPKHKPLVATPRFLETMRKCFTPNVANKFGVIVHDDLWTTNLMFQHLNGDTKQPQAVRLLDWQQARYCSPAQDLLFQIFSATDKAFRDQYYDKLLNTYYESLSQIVRRLGSDPEKVFSFQDLQDEMRKFGEYAIICAPMILQFRLSSSEDVCDLDVYSDAVENGIDAVMFKDFDEQKQRLFVRLVNEIINDLIEYGYVEC